ncbi:MAG: IS66 family transposase [Acidobacteria bacterium]|nr:IS66 family transposase [Acidobacteriota bacterium]
MRTILLALQHQVRLMNIRFTAYEQQLAELRQQVASADDLKAEIAELRERLGQNSSNSSKPPSSDPPSYKSKLESEPKRRKKRGGQPGHQGQARTLRPVEEVDHVSELRPSNCRQCGRRLRGEDQDPERHQVAEVPQAPVIVTEYRRHTLRCRHCGIRTRAEWPVQMPAGSFGPRAQALIGYFTGRLALSHRDCVEALEVLYGLEVGLGSIASIQRGVSAALAETVAEARHFVQQQKAQHVDETSWCEGRQQKWLWVNATADVTTFHLLDGRGTKEAQQVISQAAKGIIATDRYGSYNWLPARRRQICWAHLKRDFQAFVDRGGRSAETGRALLVQVKRVFALWHQFRDDTLSREQLQAKIKAVRRQVKKLLEAGAHSEQAKTSRTCQNILKVEQSLWTFVRTGEVEPTNNTAERGLRRAVLWRRKSFGTQSEAGSRFVERILTAVQSLRQQGRDVLAYLTAACRAALGDKAPGGLVPDTS